MENITYFLQQIQSLATLLFVLRTNIEPVTLLHSVPDDLLILLDDPQLNSLLDQACLAASSLSEFLHPFLKLIHSYTHSKKRDKDPMIPYADFQVDERPVLKKHEFKQISFEDVIKDQNIAPVKRRKPFSYDGCCPYCNAPKDYLYSNNGNNPDLSAQYFCKICKNTFTDKVSPKDSSGFYCPHCNSKLYPKHDRSGYIVYVCQSRKCPYYIDHKKRKDEGDLDGLITSSNQFRYHYHFREFKFNFDEIKDYSLQLDSPVNLARIHFDPYTLALVLTYFVNYGMSSRKTAAILFDIHGISISHQTVINYANSVSCLIKDMVDYYPYRLSSTQAADETYVHVQGKNHYVFFFSDPSKKFITSYNIFKNRDTKAAVLSMWNVLKKFNGDYPSDLSLIADGNPIYNAAQLFFEMQDIHFDLHQVIGVKNNDAISKKFRPFKQVEERLNRSYKQEFYYNTYGYSSLDNANSFMVLYVAFFNFLRNHRSLDFSTPVDLDCLKDCPLMTDKWLALIQFSSNFHRFSA